MNAKQRESIERAEHDLDNAETDSARDFYSRVLHDLKVLNGWGKK